MKEAHIKHVHRSSNPCKPKPFVCERKPIKRKMRRSNTELMTYSKGKTTEWSLARENGMCNSVELKLSTIGSQ